LLGVKELLVEIIVSAPSGKVVSMNYAPLKNNGFVITVGKSMLAWKFSVKILLADYYRRNA
jgi:hypothetical protein